MSILITGGTGFIGGHLIKKLTRGTFKVLSRNIKHKDDENYIFTPINSIQLITDWDKILTKTDTIIHLAGAAHNNESDPNIIHDINYKATKELAKSAVKAKVKRFIFISSVNVTNLSANEVSTSLSASSNIVDIVAFTKLKSEMYLSTLAAKTGMEVVIIRPPLVYGPGVKANFAAMLKLAATGIPLPFGCINKNKRSMVYVGNLISLIEECIENPNAANNTFLVSDDNDLSTKEFVKSLSLGLGKSGLMIPVPKVLFSIAGKMLGKSAVIDRLCGSLQVDIKHTKETLNWQPPYSTEQGFSETTKYFKDRH
jgi:nucleoside-diphosphate-sugar epimerase